MATQLQIGVARDWLAALADEAIADADDLILVTRALAKAYAGQGATGATAMLEACRIIGEAGDPAMVIAAASALPVTGDAALDDAMSVYGLIMAALAFVRRDYPSSSEASAARGVLADLASPAYERIGAAFGSDMLTFVAGLIGTASVELSRIAANRAPIVRAEVGLSLPATLMAWELYQDPARAGDLTGRNAVGTPHYMPTRFEALAE